ncbi:DUF2569 domain-containing protein [Tepidibacter aestuarii]|uniref:DUF2569 domain-containing protein n=1 Tax=Tepidibacter aestuarii TaxID=2925782 RepID=UPI0020BDD2CE|nr:DUF2569 domain-containing protein [Tepidibacter aestuarii]CAH2213498.1 conserved membrane protein of unknown function [Tepidibacter aestuarii]
MSTNNIDETNNVEEVEYKGLGGWLILLGIGIVLNPLNSILSTYTIFKACFSEGKWSILTSPTSETYHILLKPTIIFEFATNIIMVILSLTVLVLFFKKSKHFPKVWITNFLVLILFLAIDIVLCNQIPSIPVDNLYTQLFKNIIPLAIWGTYLKKSKRVRNTFVK